MAAITARITARPTDMDIPMAGITAIPTSWIGGYGGYGGRYWHCCGWRGGYSWRVTWHGYYGHGGFSWHGGLPCWRRWQSRRLRRPCGGLMAATIAMSGYGAGGVWICQPVAWVGRITARHSASALLWAGPSCPARRGKYRHGPRRERAQAAASTRAMAPAARCVSGDKTLRTFRRVPAFQPFREPGQQRLALHAAEDDLVQVRPR